MNTIADKVYLGCQRLSQTETVQEIKATAIGGVPGFADGFLFADGTCAIINSVHTRIFFYRHDVGQPDFGWLPCDQVKYQLKGGHND